MDELAAFITEHFPRYQERFIDLLRYRYGDDPQSYKWFTTRWNVTSRERVRQVNYKFLRHLRHPHVRKAVEHLYSPTLRLAVFENIQPRGRPDSEIGA